jgi:hypothetical protein
MVEGETALGRSGAEAMGKVKIQYVQRLPRCGEDLPPDVVELWIGVSGRKVDVSIVRRGFILAAPVMRIIRERIKHFALATSGINKPLPERIGFSPDLSPDWRQFLDDLLQQDDSWSFLVNSVGSERPS